MHHACAKFAVYSWHIVYYRTRAKLLALQVILSGNILKIISPRHTKYKSKEHSHSLMSCFEYFPEIPLFIRHSFKANGECHSYALCKIIL